jgi:O-acetyl-ADP-ribose deacetylase (regulator of RNase III)
LVQFDFPLLLRLENDPAAYGQALTAALFGDPDLRSGFVQARNEAKALGLPLRLRLLIDPSAPELHGLRWEMLSDPREGYAPLATDEGILFSRYLVSSDWRPVRLRPRSDVRALVVIANPTNSAAYRPGNQPLPPVDVNWEMRLAQAALADLPVTMLSSEGRASLTSIFEHLRDPEGYDILYLVCHAALPQGESLLWLEEDGPGHKAHLVSAKELALLINELANLPRLAVLVSCQGAGPGEGEPDALAAIGPRLAEAGIPAVLAMQGDFTVETAARFMPVFFRELLQDGQVDRAVAVARGAVRDRQDWWVPALFMRLRSGRLWSAPDPGSVRTEQTVLSSGRWVLVAGLGRYSLPREVEWVSRELGRRIAHDGHGLITGGWEGVDYVVAEEFERVLTGPGMQASGRLIHIRPRGHPPAYPRGEVIYVEPGRAEFAGAVARCDVVILVSGAGATYDIYLAAREAGKPTLPLAGTGGDARHAFDHARAQWPSRPVPGLTFEEFEALGREIRSEENAGAVAEQVGQILLRLPAPRPLSREEALERIRLTRSDLLEVAADAWVCPTGESLDLNGATGRKLAAALGPYYAARLEKRAPVPLGSAVAERVEGIITRHIINAPVREGRRIEPQTVQAGIQAALRVAEGLGGVRTLVVPAPGVSAGRAVAVAPTVVEAVFEHLQAGTRLEAVTLSVPDPDLYATYEAALRGLGGTASGGAEAAAGSELLFANGIDGSTGAYLLPPLTADAISALARGEAFGEDHLREVRIKTESVREATF